MEELNKTELLALLRAYDAYIQEANTDDLYQSGWRPVCIAEFFDNEFQEL